MNSIIHRVIPGFTPVTFLCTMRRQYTHGCQKIYKSKTAFTKEYTHEDLDKLMKTIGLIGGASPISTIEYYRTINNEINYLMGGHHSAEIVMVSIDFESVVHSIFEDDYWVSTTEIILNAAVKLQDAGADFIVLCCNTFHKVLPAIGSKLSIPILHILQPVSDAIVTQKIKKVLLLGTDLTMQQDFHKDYLKKHSSVEVITPQKHARLIINKIIFEELCHGVIKPESRERVCSIIFELQRRYGIEAVILACTELPLLIGSGDCTIPVLKTTGLHAKAAAHYALSELYLKAKKPVKLTRIS